MKKELKSERNPWKFKMMGVLGRGGQAAVVKARRNIDNSYFALKCTERTFFSTKNEELNARRWRQTKLELQIMSELDSPYVVKFVEFINTEPDHFFCVQELANGGNLKEMMKRLGGSLPESCAKKVLIQIINGFNYLYEMKVIHRDCKLENLLIHFPARDSGEKIPWKHIDLDVEPFIIKIADFGYSRFLDQDDELEGWYGTPLLMAPEALFGQKYGHKRDVWALGAMYFQLITGKYIFGHDKCTL